MENLRGRTAQQTARGRPVKRRVRVPILSLFLVRTVHLVRGPPVEVAAFSVLDWAAWDAVDNPSGFKVPPPAPIVSAPLVLRSDLRPRSRERGAIRLLREFSRVQVLRACTYGGEWFR